MLRAMRRANASGKPSAAVNGSTVIASAPPRAAANTAMVARRMFTCGSRRVSMRHAVSAETNAGAGASAARSLDARPQFPQRAEFRDGEKLIRIGGRGERRSCAVPHRARRLPPRARADRRVATASTKASSCASEPPALWITRPSAAACGPAKPSRASAASRRAKCGASSLQRRAPPARDRHGAERIVADAKVARRRRQDAVRWRAPRR